MVRREMQSMILGGILVINTLLPLHAQASLDDQPQWNPQLSERLIRLPASYLRKAIDQDFSASPLAAEITRIEDDVRVKGDTLNDLNAAVDETDGEMKSEMQHQLLVEKQNYLKMMGSQLQLKRRQIKTERRFYQRLMEKIEATGRTVSAPQQQLLEQQQQARQRFESSVAQVDMNLFGNGTAEESRYGKQYSKNLASLQKLVTAIGEHPMNRQLQHNGEPISKIDYIRQMVAESDASLALVEQEETMLGYMAKLIALDALALSEMVEDAEQVDSSVNDQSRSIASMVDFFVNR